MTGTTGILTQKVYDPEDLAQNPEKYLADLYVNEDVAARAWLRTGERHHFTWNDGVVTLSWQGMPLVGVPTWDDVCGIWRNLVAVVEGYLSAGRGEALFPDQPIPIILERIRGAALITIGDTKIRVDALAFCSELLDEAERFWRWTDRQEIPVNAGLELPKINQVRAKIPRTDVRHT
jgi:hypothetical protein